MRIALIEPRSPGYHVFSNALLPRLGLPILGAILRDEGHQVRVYCQEFGKIDYGAVEESDLVGLSTTTSTAPEAYRIAKRVSRKGIPVVFGGSHTTFVPDEALRYGDFSLAGEAEESFPLLVKHLTDPDAWPEIPGLSYWHGGEMRHNPRAGHMCNMNSVPIPDLSLIDYHVASR